MSDKVLRNLKSPQLKRRWLRYSFRSMLLFVTTFAIWLGFVVKGAKDQERAVQAILARGGLVQYDVEMGESYWANPTPGFKEIHSHIPSKWAMKCRSWLRPVFGQHYVDNVVTVVFRAKGRYYPSLTSKNLNLLKRLKKLEEVRGRFTDDELEHISCIPNLRLVLDGVAVSDTGLLHLQQAKNLEILQIYSKKKKVTVAGLRGLVGLRRLRRIIFVTRECVVTDTEAAYLGSLPNLKFLSGFKFNISDEGLQHLSNATRLQNLVLGGNDITDAGLIHLTRMTALEDLSLNGTGITDEGIRHIGKLTGLETLHLSGTAITDEGINELMNLKRLQFLDVSNCNISDAALKQLQRLPALTELNVLATNVSDGGLKEFQRAIPICEIRH